MKESGESIELNDVVAEKIARMLAPAVLAKLDELFRARESDDYVRGTTAIARVLGVSEDTFRRRLAKKIPICGYEEYNHRGKIAVRPICKRSDLTNFRENLRPKKNNPKV